MAFDNLQKKGGQYMAFKILLKKGGKFGKIWMAATNMMKLTRREVASINVEDSCKQVLEYIEIREEESRRKRPQLSLYLSAQLMYGIVRTYNKQCEYLLVDAESIFLRVQHMQGLKTDIDLKQLPRPDHVTNPEFQTDLMADEFYMVLDELDGRGTPLQPLHSLTQESMMSHSSNSKSGSSQSKRSNSRFRKEKRKEAGSSHTVDSLEQITLIELPSILVDTPLSPIPVPKDMELPTMMGQDIDLQLQPEEPALAVKDLLPASTPKGTLPPAADRSARPKDTRDQQTTEESLTGVQQAEKEKTPERTHSSQEVPVTRAVPRSPEITQIITSPLPRRQRPRRSLHLDPVLEPKDPSKRRKRKQLRFADTVTQIPKIQIKKHMATSRDTLQPFHLVDLKGAESTDWMTVPGRKEFREKPLSLLWSRNARFIYGLTEAELPKVETSESDSSNRTTTGPQIPVEEQPGFSNLFSNAEFVATRLQLDEEQRIPAAELPQPEPRPADESIEVLRQISAAAENLEIGEVEMPSVEVARDASTSRILEPESLNLSDIIPADDSAKKAQTLSASKRRSRSASSRKSAEELEPQTPLTHSSLHTSTIGPRSLYNISEESRFVDQLVPVPDLPKAVAAEGVCREEELLRTIKDELSHHNSKKTTFRAQFPPQHFTRKEAARGFTALLGLCAKKDIQAVQASSFGEIYIVVNEHFHKA